MIDVFDSIPWLIVGGAVVAAVIGLMLFWAVRRRARFTTFAEPALLRRLAGTDGTRGSYARPIRLSLAATFAALALGGPRWGSDGSVVTGQGVDVVLALDASLSMLARDVSPSRLERMKQEVQRLEDQNRGDRFALLAFAGRSYILTPLTVDEGALDLFLGNLEPSVVGQAGSSIARAIIQGTDLLSASPASGDRALVIMSDGEAFEPEADVVEAAQRAEKAGIDLVTVGFGTPEGATIPVREGDQIVPKRDDAGQIVVTKYTPGLLQAAATAAHGDFIDAAVPDKAGRIRQALGRLHATRRTIQRGRGTIPRFQWLLAPAVLLLLLDTLLGDRRKVGRAVAAATLVTVNGCTVFREDARAGIRAYREGNVPRALSLFRYATAHGDARPVTAYDLGTALLAADSLEGAADILDRVTRVPNPELQYRATFNTGLVSLKRGLAGQRGADTTDAFLDAALELYKNVLRARPGDIDAKWNYELALREKKKGGGGGGGGGAGGGGASNARNPQDKQAEQPAGSLGQQRAEELLKSAEREERGVQGRKLRQNRPPPPGGKDW